VLTPKSLLRLAATRSTVEELTEGRFQDVLPDPARPDPQRVRQVLLASGKVYYDLAKRRDDDKLEDVALLRVEQLYPFPEERIRERLGKYPNAHQVLWVQEEPENMGAWSYLAVRFERAFGKRLELAGREEAAAPATGSPSIHQGQQRRLLDRALTDL
jgi:2-oxoglutarate dehydrogenase E1 component